ncbi:DsrE/DsrF/DrsH-like family protein [Brachybacterium sp. EF45031]|uniref:DsrE/DsrF/DrsH-like family protein n=1 Tax=Brachybacterium sillae TaxID=2810536 RepID=UPI00217D1A7F|nr:DsrE/DsrF/DrsH-like family protein [Brachybacterium sillae]MCS6711925.1 DsrE/DsrF/DrsH-like family protein [Brachybacterium sillae]
MPLDAHGNIIPDFGTNAARSSGATPDTPSTSAAGAAAAAGPRKMAFICSKGNLDMAYPALIMANAALSEGIDVDIFFTFWGLDLVDVRTADSLKFTFSGNTAMHMPELERLRGGLGTASMPQALAVLPGVTGFATRMMKKQMADLEIPTVREMLEQISAMGGKLWACKLTVEMMKIKEANLVSEIDAIISATDFIEKSAGAQIVFV